MRRILLMNKVLWKQYFYRHRTWFVFLLVAALLLHFWYPNNQKESFAGLLIGVCAMDEDGKELLKRLQKQKTQGDAGEVFNYCEYKEQEEMLRDVKNGTLECGYVLPEKFFEKLSDGKIHNQIILYHSTASGAHKLSYEMVFCHLLDMLSEEILQEWFKESELENITDKAEAAARLQELKENYENGDATFSFAFRHVGERQEEKQVSLDSVRGLIGVVIFFLALLGLANSCEMAGRFGAFAHRQAKMIEYISLHIAVAGSVLFGGLFMILAGRGGRLLYELVGHGIYFVILLGYLFVLKWILRTKEAIYGAMPVLLLGSILFCPVFFRIETFIPAMGYLGKAFPVYWYLNFFA